MNARSLSSTWWIAAAVALAAAGCREEDPDLEEQVDGDLSRKAPCDTLPATGYRIHPDVTEPGAIEVVDCGFRLPSRLAFSPDGGLLLVTQLKGQVYAYVRGDDETFTLQPGPLHDLGDLGVRDEAGLSAAFFTDGFDLDGEAEQREVFLTYQEALDAGPRNRVTRLRLARDGDGVAVEDAQVLWTGTEPSGQAHQIQQGVAFRMLGAVHLLIAVGDGNDPAYAADPAGANGTLQLMQRDGSAPLGTRPWPAHPYTQAIGHRNAYGMTMLPAEIDARQGVVGIENGNSRNDRAWFVRAVDLDGDNDRQLDLGYRGSDREESWTAAGDAYTTGALGEPRNAVFRLFSPVVAPTSIAMHPGGVGPIPASTEGAVSLVAAFFGESGEGSLGPGKNIQLLRVSNLSGAALQASATVLVDRDPSTDGDLRHPVGLDVDPVTGDVWFADILTGELSRVVFE